MNFTNSSISLTLQLPSTNMGQSASDSINYLNCFSIYDDVVYVSSKTRAIIVIFYFIIFVINTIANGICIYINVVTNQWKNQSMRAILFISINDILNGVLGYTAHVIHIMIPNQLDCRRRRYIVLFPHLFIHISLYLIMFLALDRFLHVMLLSRYKDFIKPIRFYLCMAFYLAVAVMQTVITTFGPNFFGENGGASYSAPVNSLFISVTIAIYIASILKLRIYTKSSRDVSARTLSLSRLASAFLVILAVTYTPIILYTGLLKKVKIVIGSANANIVLHSLLILANTNSSFNAIAYLKLNSKARRQVNAILQKVVSSYNTGGEL